jgi:hypothetical protein
VGGLSVPARIVGACFEVPAPPTECVHSQEHCYRSYAARSLWDHPRVIESRRCTDVCSVEVVRLGSQSSDRLWNHARHVPFSQTAWRALRRGARERARLGEPGDTQAPVISPAHIAGIPLVTLCCEQGLPYEPDALKRIASDTRTAGLEIQQAKGATYYGIGAALVRIVAAILRDKHAVLTVSAPAPEAWQFGEVCLSLPRVISREGVDRALFVPLYSEDERQAVQKSAEVLKKHISVLDLRDDRATTI